MAEEKHIKDDAEQTRYEESPTIPGSSEVAGTTRDKSRNLFCSRKNPRALRPIFETFETLLYKLAERTLLVFFDSSRWCNREFDAHMGLFLCL